MANPHTATDPVAQNLSNAEHGKGLPVPDTGTHAVTLEHGGPSEEHPDPAVFGLDATVWVSIAMAVFVAILVWQKVPGLVTRALDGQIAAIRARLDEAKALRAEAEALRDEYAKKIAGAEAQAQAMLDHADQEAAAVIAQAEADAKELTARRAKMAEDKIAAAERTAIAEIRARAADAATRAATVLIAEKHGAAADKPLVDQTIAGLSRVN